MSDPWAAPITSRPTAIYLDNHATTPLDPRVYEAMAPWFLTAFGNPHSQEHSFGWSAHAAAEDARADVANLVGADADEIIFTSGATEANNIAILGIARALKSHRPHIIVSAIEHSSVLAAARALSREGFEVEIAPVDSCGLIDLDILKRIVSDRTALVSVGAVNGEIGTIQYLDQVRVVCERVGALLHSDGAQAPMAGPISADQVDLLSLSAHKIYGPKGIGALYIRRDIACRPQPILFGGEQEDGLRPGTLPVPLCVGFGRACQLVLSEGDVDRARIRKLSQRLLTGLRRSVAGILLNGPIEHRHPGNLNIQVPSLDASTVLARVQPDLAASTGSACMSGQPFPSHVLRAIGLSVEAADSSIRFGIGRFTTTDEIDRAVALIDLAVRTAVAA